MNHHREKQDIDNQSDGEPFDIAGICLGKWIKQSAKSRNNNPQQQGGFLSHRVNHKLIIQFSGRNPKQTLIGGNILMWIFHKFLIDTVMVRILILNLLNLSGIEIQNGSTRACQ